MSFSLTKKLVLLVLGTLKVQAQGHDFGYGPTDGPLLWTSPDPLEWGLCGRGLHQSPINLNSGSATLQPSNSFTFDYQTLHNVPLVSTHHTIQAQADQINTINTLTFDNGKVYDLAQFHFHSPGEHQLDGEFFPMEVHFVHTSKDGSRAVVGFVIEVGNSPPDPLLQSVLAHTGDASEPNFTLDSIDFTSIINNSEQKPVWRYTGSLTTPPCDEGVEWIVSDTPLVIDVSTFDGAKAVLKFNSLFVKSDPGDVKVLENGCLGLVKPF